MFYVVHSGLAFMCVAVCVDPVSVALIETLLEELPCSAVFWSELPSNNGYHTRIHLNWVVPPQLVLELSFYLNMLQ